MIYLFAALAFSVSHLSQSNFDINRHLCITLSYGSSIRISDIETEERSKSKLIIIIFNLIFNPEFHRYIMYENGKIIDLKDPFLLSNTDKEVTYDISIVVPAYNEFNRMPKMMSETLNVIFYSENNFFSFSILMRQ
jgi:hypothetical protein